MTLTDFTLSNARRFYSSMGNPLTVKELTTEKTMSPLTLNCRRQTHDTSRFYSVSRQTILHVNWEPLGSERVKVKISEKILRLIGK